jgi:hypothetical protein
LGRIYKSQWTAARQRGDAAEARRLLLQAVGAYLRGFETDWRDIYPGINAVTLLEVQGGERARAKKDLLLPVVRFATEQRLRSPTPDYWDHACLLELAVLAGDSGRAMDALDDVLTSPAEPWQLQSTADNLRRVHEAWEERGHATGWLPSIIEALDTQPGQR